MAPSLATSREDSFTIIVYRFLVTVPYEPTSGSCRTSQDGDFVSYFHPSLRKSFYLTGPSLPSSVRTKPIITLCFAPHQRSGTRSQSSTRPYLNFFGVSSLFSSPKVVLSPLGWILLNGYIVSLRSISSDLSYGTVAKPRSNTLSSVQVGCSGLICSHDWALPIGATKPTSPNRSLLKPKLKIEDALHIDMMLGIWGFLSENSGGFTRISPRST